MRARGVGCDLWRMKNFSIFLNFLFGVIVLTISGCGGLLVDMLQILKRKCLVVSKIHSNFANAFGNELPHKQENINKMPL